MDINFFDEPDMAPQPRDKMEIVELSAEPYTDRRRVRIHLEVTPFTPADKPNIAINTTNDSDEPVGSMTIIETMQHKMNLILHIREPEPSGTYQVEAALYFGEDDPQHTRETTFELPEAEK